MARLKLSEQQWQRIEPLFPKTDRSRGGRPPVEKGRAIAWPNALAGDKGNRTDRIDNQLLDLGITPVIPSKSNENRDSRPVPFDKEAYRDSNIVERLIGWLKESRRIFSRFERTAKNFDGMIKLGFIRRYLRLTFEGL